MNTTLYTVLGLLLYLYIDICVYFIAIRLKQNRPWLAFVPLVNIPYLFQISGVNGLGCVLLIIPIVNIVVLIDVWSSIARKLGQGSILGASVIVPPVHLIVIAYLAFWDGTERKKWYFWGSIALILALIFIVWQTN
jgi:hypothetical protein